MPRRNSSDVARMGAGGLMSRGVTNLNSTPCLSEPSRIRQYIDAHAREVERHRYLKSRVWDITVEERSNGEMMLKMTAGRAVQERSREAGAGD